MNGKEVNMRTIHTDTIIGNIKEMCMTANYKLSVDMVSALEKSINNEKSELGKQILEQLKENLKIAGEEKLPICQDTGMTVVFFKIGQDVHIIGQDIEKAINEGIRQGYEEGYLRKSVVLDPIIRNNTNDNTPGIIHYEIIPGENVEMTIAPKGFGSENMSRIYMLKPSDGVEGIKKAVIETVLLAGPNACPPIVVGVGIGGTFEKSAFIAKKALARNIGEFSEQEHIKKLEQELLIDINNLGIGPAGLGGSVTALGVNIETYPTHIAGLPVAINICCHVNRHLSRII